MRNKIYVAQSTIKHAGRGVFASSDIKKGEVIEVCPILIFDSKDTVHIMDSLLQRYVFEYAGDSTMLALGFGSLYNNRRSPNAKYELQEYIGMPEQSSELLITAVKPIAKDEEIFINYGIPDYLKTLNA